MTDMLTPPYAVSLPDYSAGVSAGTSAGASLPTPGKEGIVCCTGCALIWFWMADCPLFSPRSMKNTTTMQSTIMAPASVQVAFSRKSVVLRTPIIWFEDAKEEAKPPPLEFCTNTININKRQIMNTKTEIAVYMVISNY